MWEYFKLNKYWLILNLLSLLVFGIQSIFILSDPSFLQVLLYLLVLLLQVFLINTYIYFNLYLIKESFYNVQLISDKKFYFSLAVLALWGTIGKLYALNFYEIFTIGIEPFYLFILVLSLLELKDKGKVYKGILGEND